MSEESSPAPEESTPSDEAPVGGGGGGNLVAVVILIAVLAAVGYGAYAYIFEDPSAGSEIDRSQPFVVEYADGEEPDGGDGP